MADQGGAYGCGVAAGGCGGCEEDCRSNDTCQMISV